MNTISKVLRTCVRPKFSFQISRFNAIQKQLINCLTSSLLTLNSFLEQVNIGCHTNYIVGKPLNRFSRNQAQLNVSIFYQGLNILGLYVLLEFHLINLKPATKIEFRKINHQNQLLRDNLIIDFKYEIRKILRK